jgi:hypothetical protein
LIREVLLFKLSQNKPEQSKVEKLQILSYKLNDRQIKELAQKISNDLSVPQDVIYALIKQES